MDPRFKIPEQVFYRRDRFDIPLDSYLFDTIRELRIISRGEDPLWKKVVADLLSTYFLRLTTDRMYHFKLSYGYPHRDKTKRQIEFEKHISLLEHTAARAYISQVCIEALKGRAWQALQSLHTSSWRTFLKPRFLLQRVLGMPGQFLMSRLLKTGGVWMALEIFGLFKSLTDQECDAILAYLQRQDHGERAALYFLNILTRPGMVSDNARSRLEALVFSMSFEEKETQQQAYARLARISLLALQKLTELFAADQASYGGQLSRDLLNTLASAAGANATVMEYWLKEADRIEVYSSSSGLDDTFRRNLGVVGKDSLQVLFRFAQNEDAPQSKFAQIVLRSIDQVAPAAQRQLYSYLKSDDRQERYLAARTLSGLAVPDPSLTEDIFQALLEVALGSGPLEVTNEAYQSRDPLQEKIRQLLLEVAQDRQDLSRNFLISLRDRWSDQFVDGVARICWDAGLSQDKIKAFAQHLQHGEIEACQKILDENRQQMLSSTYEEISEALGELRKGDMLVYALYAEGTIAQRELSRLCLGYTLRVWPCLVTVSEKLSDLTSTNAVILAAFLCLTNPNRNRWQGAPIVRPDSDSYTLICADIGRAINVVNSFDVDDLVVEILVQYLNTPRTDRDLVMRAISCFPRQNKRLQAILRQELAGAYDDRKKQALLQNAARLDEEGVSMIVQSILSHTASSTVLETPQMVDAAGAQKLVDTLRKRKELTDNEVNELWLFIYAIKALVHSSAINEDVIDICKDLLREKVGVFDDHHTRDERPFAVWALSRVRPLRPDILNLLKNIAASGPSRLMANGHYVWTKVAAVIALSEIASDTTNELVWEEREKIADIIIKFVKLPFQTDFSLFGREHVFPEKPSDAVYDAAVLIVETMRKHWAQVDYEVPDSID